MKISEDGYLNVQRWMITRLGLGGNDLLVYALIYGFSQDGTSEFYGGNKYISEWIGKSKRAVISILNFLETQGYISKRQEVRNGKVVSFYKANPLNDIESENSSPYATNAHMDAVNAPCEVQQLQNGLGHNDVSIYNNKKSKLNDNLSCNICSPKQLMEFFDEFWKEYPRKQSKKDARSSFLKLKVTIEEYQTILNAVRLQKQTIWKGKEMQYIPLASSWINKERWTDEIGTVSQEWIDPDKELADSLPF